jgi:hypothetical protein
MALEYDGIASRAELRARLERGEVDMRKWRGIGEQGAQKLIDWAHGRDSTLMKRGLRLRVSSSTVKALDELRSRRGLASRDEFVEELVTEALSGPG